MSDTSKRLEQLPAKIANPFRQLLTAGQLNEETVESILDAGDIAGQSTRLIGFTAGFLHLRSQGVPVHDVIRMAKQQKRRINLSWSPARWKNEHDKLSRAEALTKMSTENVPYEVKVYQRHLPKRFAGYLIKSSRRLGMEGFRQRHCVANYDDQIRAGSCAIAAVFIDRKRWTVQLELTKDKKAPLRIVQIRSRLNAMPTTPVRQQIHAELGIKAETKAPTAYRDNDRGDLYLRNLRLLLQPLRHLSIERVTISFDGSGDNGSVQDISFSPIPNQQLLDRPVSVITKTTAFDDGQWRTTEGLQDRPICDALEEITYDYLEETGVDWVNDDGGFGELIINVQTASMQIEVSTRYSHSSVEFTAERDIQTGEDLT